jgi:hypothetical protein
MTPQKPENLVRDARAILPWNVEIRRELHRFPELRGTTRKRSELFLRLTLWRAACAFLIALATLVYVGIAASAASGDQPQDADVPARMLPLLRAIQSRELEELQHEQAARDDRTGRGRVGDMVSNRAAPRSAAALELDGKRGLQFRPPL